MIKFSMMDFVEFRNVLKIIFVSCLFVGISQGFTISLVPSNTFIVETQSTDLLMSTVGESEGIAEVNGSLTCQISKTEVLLTNGQSSTTFGSPFSIGSGDTGINSGTLFFNTFGNNVFFNADSPFKLSFPRYQVFVTCKDSNGVSEEAPIPSVLITVLSNRKPSFASPIVKQVINVGLNASALPNSLQYNITANVINDQATDVLSFSVRNTEPKVDYFDVNEGKISGVSADEASRTDAGQLCASVSNFFPTIASTGIVTNKIDLRTATVSPIELTIDVSDGFNSAERSLTLEFELLNMNQRPDIVGLPATLNVDEDTQTLRLVDLSVTDEGVPLNNVKPDCIVTPTGGTDVFDFVTRPISLKPRGTRFGRTFLDFETTPKYIITCTVSDGFLTSQGEVLTVNVNNVNEAPIFRETLFYCTMDESMAGESACNLGFNIKDPEGNQFITRLFQDDNSNRFALTSTSNNLNNDFFGENDRLTFNTNYDVDEGRMPSRMRLLILGAFSLLMIKMGDMIVQVTLFVNAIDEFGATGTATISVVVRDVNDNTPEFDLINTAIEVDYSTNTGLLGVIRASDDDDGTNGELDYRLVSVVPPNAINYVSILGNGDIQYIRQYPDSLAGSSVYLSVEAKDRGTPAKSSTGTVVVSLIATTTTSTTPLPTTTTTISTTTLTTTTEAEFFDKSENVAIFAVLMVLLLLLLLLALYFCFRWCITGSCTGGSPGGGGGGMCDCCQPAAPPPRRVTPIVYEEFPPVTSGDYKGDFWRSGDYYESGRPF
ncbi:hypothetical protein LOTGIDRAFT_237680 [Lottia gigantea]|uniref:Cadherin domain-containing protein n=1 Tax=Lottia gigantea TaxID=225164 RepID=V4BBE8_LOTGI|nr:hypothetical protein LOTGIDRAFT_237680 [Lottia gigantea]ESP03362.1 hypothetical protein LOTGIDRAFT_237680 [Lottia gigantea]